MSLIDAVLVNDPVPGEIWIAIRPSEVRGSGSENDPYNGARANHPILTVSTLNVAASGADFLVTLTTSVAHGFKANDSVLITGITNPDGELLNGVFQVTPVAGQASQFTYLVSYSSLAQYPSPALGSFSPGGITCQKDPFLFDAVMSQLSALGKPVTVRLGPGVFETKGYADFRSSVSWSPFAGLRMRGGGIGVTTIKLVAASSRNRHFWAIGMPTLGSPANPADDFTASDFTIDSDASGQLTSQVTCGAVALRSSGTRIQRIRVINHGRLGPLVRTREIDPGSGVWESVVVTPELFTISVGGSTWKNNLGKYQSKDCVVEDCIIEQPHPNSVRESTMMISAASDVDSGSMVPIGTLACVFRRNYVNCEYQRTPHRLQAVVPAQQSNVIRVTVTTATAHGLSSGQWVRISGVKIAGAYDGNGYTTNLDGYSNYYNGSFVVAVLDSVTFWYETGVDAPAIPAIEPVVGAWVNLWPSDFVKVKSVSAPAPVAGTNYQVTVETDSPHFLIERGSGASIPYGCIAYLDDIAEAASTTKESLNVPWVVTRWVSNTQFECQRDYEGKAPPNPTGTTAARLGAKWQAMTGATAIEENHVRSCAVAGHYVDSYGLRATSVRRNVFSGVRVGMFVTLTADYGQMNYTASRPTVAFVPPIRTTGSGPSTRWFATFEMTSGKPHFFVVGQGVLITNAKKAAQSLDKFNRSFAIVDVPSSARLEIELDEDPGSLLPDNTPSLTWLWITEGCTFEDNLIEIIPGTPNSGVFANGIQSGGVSFEGIIKASIWISTWPPARRNFWRHLGLLLRRNTIRYAALPNGSPMTGFPLLESAISLQKVGSCLSSLNTVDLRWRPSYTNQTPFLQIDCAPLAYERNYSSAGVYTPGTDRSAGNTKRDGVVGVVVDAQMLAWL